MMLLDSAEWYALERAGVGPEFLRSVKASLAAIEENPLRFPQIFHDARRAQVARFPFGVFFVIRHDTIYVFAIVHLHRNPKHWKQLAPPKNRKLP